MRLLPPSLCTALLLLFTLTFSSTAYAQADQVRASPMATTSQRVGLDTDVTITYSRPAVKGREVWGGLVPWGMAEGNKYSDNKPFPWRAGANENTTVTFSKDVTVAGEALPAGTYGLHMIPAQDDAWTLIFNKVSNIWGSYQYDETQDALRVSVTPEEAPMQEWLTYGFDPVTPTSTEAYLHWEKLKVPFEIAAAGN
ncbi:DUF2911 domain-containing protein [Lewinella sp. IMCC34183]|uniref:DUF2911 domain-containing protein n=1 Tax=Lewinella sp. IMCC34183 TaxID=2248762 RepID=UPI000E26FF06|nr:DUF2911 domain-containing protein [Lewinella sp. IMCC34183]